MAKISDLLPPPNPITGAEKIPVVQDGSTWVLPLGKVLSDTATAAAEQVTNLAAYVAPEMVKVIVAQFGVTFSFSRPRLAGQYANGDWWVLGPVSITSITPASTVQTSGVDGDGAAITNRVVHGTTVNPGHRSFAAGGLASNNGGNVGHGWDSIANPIAPTAPYVAAFNVDPGKTGVPLSIDSGSVVKFVSRLNGLPVRNRPAGLDQVVLTVVDSVPPPNSIRPGVSRADKTSVINASMFDLSVFKNIAPPASAPTFATVLGYVSRFIEVSQTNSINNTTVKAINNHPEYGRDVGHYLHTACLALHLNFTAEQKLALLSHMAAIADDLVSRAEEGGITAEEGGGNQFKKAIVCVVGAALGANRPASWTTYLSFANRNVWAEDGQIFNVSGRDLAMPRDTSDGRPRDPYTYQMIGSAEWGEQAIRAPNRSASQWSAFYRSIVSGQLLAGTLAVELTAGAKALWDHPAFWAYMDTAYLRRLEIESGGNAVTPFAKDMIAAHRPADPVAPTIVAATIKNNAIAIRFDKALDEVAAIPPASSFAVNVNGAPVAIASVSVWRQNCGLALNAPVIGNDTVTVSYSPGANPLKSARGVNVASFSARALVNQTDKIGGPNAAFPVIRFSADDRLQMNGSVFAASNSPVCTVALMKFKFDALPAGEVVLLGTTAGGPPFVILFGPSGRLELRFRDAAGAFVARIRSPVLAPGIAYDLLWSFDVRDATAGGFNLYIDGQLATTQVNSYAGGASKVIGFNTLSSQGNYAWNFSGTVFEIGAFWMDTATRVDLTSSANRNKFGSLTNGNLDVLTRGDGITGSPPAHFHVGNADQWNDAFGMNRGTGPKFFVTAGEVSAVSGPVWI